MYLVMILIWWYKYWCSSLFILYHNKSACC